MRTSALPCPVIAIDEQSIRSLPNLCCISVSSREIEQRHQRHAVETHAFELRLPAVEEEAVRDEDEGGEPKGGVHGGAVGAEGWMAEIGVHGCE